MPSKLKTKAAGGIVAPIVALALFAWRFLTKRNPVPAIHPERVRSALREEPEWSEDPGSGSFDMWKSAAGRHVVPPVAQAAASRWSLALLQSLDWHRFERLCAEYFKALGFNAELTDLGPDGGVDIRLTAEGASTPGILVQCKVSTGQPVKSNVVRELLGVMTDAKVSEGILVTTGVFTVDATRFAERNNMHLIDGATLLGRLAQLSEENSQRLLEKATEGDYLTPTCPACGIRMVLRKNGEAGEQYWGCVKYPQCRQTLRLG